MPKSVRVAAIMIFVMPGSDVVISDVVISDVVISDGVLG